MCNKVQNIHQIGGEAFKLYLQFWDEGSKVRVPMWKFYDSEAVKRARVNSVSRESLARHLFQ